MENEGNGENRYSWQSGEGSSTQGMEEDNIWNSRRYTDSAFGDLDYDLCKRCHRRRIDRSQNPQSVLCGDCREELIRLRIPPVFYLVGAVVVLLVVFTMAVSIGGIRNFGSYNRAESTAEDGYILTTMNDLIDILEENPDNKDAAIKLTDIGMQYAYYDYAAYAINNYLVGKKVSDGQYLKINGYIYRLEDYYATYDLYDEIWEEILDDAPDLDDGEALLWEFNRELSSYIGKSGYDQALLYYYLGVMSSDNEERIAYFEKCLELNPYYFDAQAQIATYYRRSGELEKARQQLESVYAINKEDYSVLRSFATLELVEGHPEQGLDYAMQAYEWNPEGDYVIDTYIIALAANGKMDEAKALVEEYEEDYIFDDDLYEFLDGNMTLEDYYIGE